MNPTRYSSVELLVALGLLFVTVPFMEDLPQGNLVETILMTVIMMSAVLATGGRRTSLVVAFILLVPVLVDMYTNTQPPSGSGLQIHNQKPKEPNPDGQS